MKGSNNYAYASVFLSAAFVIAPLFSVSTFIRVGDFVKVSKYFAFIGVVGISAPLLAIYFYQNRITSAPRISWSSFLLFCWNVYIVVNAKIQKVDLANKDLVTLSICVLLFYAICHILEKYNNLINRVILIDLLLASCSIEAAIGLLQLYGVIPVLDSHFNIEGTFRNPAPFSLFLASIMPMALATFIFPTAEKKKDSDTRKRMALTTIILCCLVLPAANIRTAWIAAAVGSLIVFNYRYTIVEKCRKMLDTLIKKVVFIFGLLSLLLMIVFCLYLVKPASAAGRVLIWKITFRQFIYQPVFGVGYSNLKKEFSNWQGSYFIEDSTRLDESPLYSEEKSAFLADNVEMAYNEYLEMATESGIVGLTLFMGYVLLILVKAVNRMRNQGAGLSVGVLGSFVAILIEGLFSYPFHSIPELMLFFLLLALLHISETNGVARFEEFNQSFKSNSRLRYHNLGLSALCLIVFMFCIRSLSEITLYEDWQRARLMIREDRGIAQHKYRELFPKLKKEPLFLADYGILLNGAGKYTEAANIWKEAQSVTSNPWIYIFSGQTQEALGNMKEATINYRLAHSIIPHYLFPCYLLAKLYESQKDTILALKYAREIIASHPKVESAFSNEMIQEMNNLVKRLGRSQ